MSVNPRARKHPTSQDPDNDGWTEPSGSEMESKIYRVLFASYQRADAAARAIARLEYELIKDLDVPEEETTATELSRSVANPEEPARAAAMREVGSEFDKSTFEGLFTNLNAIRLLRDMLDVLDMSDLRSEVTSAVIEDKFRSRPSTGSGYEGKPVIGTDSEVLVQNIKQMVARAQRNKAG